MSYGRRRNYKGRGRSSNGFGGMVGDFADIANKFGPKGTLITGALGFVTLYFIVPWALVAWAEHNKAKMSSGPLGQAMGKMLDEIFIRRFIHPAEWAGIAVLLLCIGIACWKAFTRTDVSYSNRKDMGSLAKFIARFLD